MPPLVITDGKYKFVPPYKGSLWPRILAAITPSVLRKKYGITSSEVRGVENLENLIKSGHGILLAPNHSRMSDALVLQHLARKLRQPLFVMASSHLFRGSRFVAFILRRVGAFSVNREGVDRDAVNEAIDILTKGTRPLVIFPEGALSHANERLSPLMEGVSFIARAAAKKLKRGTKGDAANDPKRKVYVVPVAIRYLYKGDIEETVARILADIERRLSWRVQDGVSLIERIRSVGTALLSLKELEHLGHPQSGELDERILRLIDQLLHPLEEEWLGGKKGESVVARVKALRKAVLPDMVKGDLDEAELNRRWRQFEDMELAQQLSLYPPRYVASKPTADRILETAERFSEHLSGMEEPHPPMSAVIQVGDPIEVSDKRDRSAESDPVLKGIEDSLIAMLEELSKECAPYLPPTKTGQS